MATANRKESAVLKINIFKFSKLCGNLKAGKIITITLLLLLFLLT